MQFQLTALASLMAFFATTNAVFVCSEFNFDTGACQGTCTNFDIALGEIIETPGTNCIFNSDQDTGFDLTICSGSNLSGDCNSMSATRRTDITGDFNWDTPSTNSIKRIGA